MLVILKSEALRHGLFDCFIFHDVDLLPEDDRNSYNCPKEGRPRHLAVLLDVRNYRYYYLSINKCMRINERMKLIKEEVIYIYFVLIF